MAEMTAENVKALLESFAALCGSNAKAKELCGDAIKFVEQQAAEIAKLKAQLDCGVQEMAETDKEIAKKDRMIEKAIDMLENNCCDAAESFDCEETNRECRACWREWLEKEAEGHG